MQPHPFASAIVSDLFDDDLDGDFLEALEDEIERLRAGPDDPPDADTEPALRARLQ